MLDKRYVLVVRFLGLFFKLAPLSNVVASTLFFLGYLALECCARLPGGALGEKEQISSNANCQSSIS